MAFLVTAGVATAGTVAAGAAAVTAGASLYSAYKSGKAADRAAKQQSRAIDQQSQSAREQLEFAKQQWNTYKTKIMPLEIEAAQLGISAQELALRRGRDDYNLYKQYYRPLQEKMAGFYGGVLEEVQDGVVDRIEPQYERRARDAAATVDAQFDRERAILRRDLQRRGVRPDEGGYFGRDRSAGLAQAAARAQAMNTARETERDRVEGQNYLRDQVNFQSKLAALTRTPMGVAAPAPSQSTNVPGLNPSSIASMFSGATGAMGSAGQNAGSLANMYANNAAGGMQAAINLGKSAMDFYNQYRTPTPAASAPVSSWSGAGGGGFGQSAVSGADFGAGAISAPSGWGYQPTMAYAEGGPVRAPALRRDDGGGGLVRGPGGIDNVPAVIQAPDGTTYDAVLTDGEYVIPKDVVMAKGGDAYFDKFVEDVRKKQIGGRRKALSRGGM